MNKQKTILLTLFLCLLQHMQGFAQQKSDEEQIRETLTNYIEGRNGGDLERLLTLQLLLSLLFRKQISWEYGV